MVMKAVSPKRKKREEKAEIPVSPCERAHLAPLFIPTEQFPEEAPAASASKVNEVFRFPSHIDKPFAVYWFSNGVQRQDMIFEPLNVPNQTP